MLDFWKKTKLGRILRRALATFSTAFFGQLAYAVGTGAGRDTIGLIGASFFAALFMAADKAIREFSEEKPDEVSQPGSPLKAKVV